MNYLLDTNVVSESMKPAPHSGVLKFLAETDEDATFLSVITLAELHFGVERLPAGAKRERLKSWLEEDLPFRFAGRILTMDCAAATEWGKTMARGERTGRPISEMDAWVAAAATIHEMILVTRNTTDFAGYKGEIFNPWT